MYIRFLLILDISPTSHDLCLDGQLGTQSLPSQKPCKAIGHPRQTGGASRLTFFGRFPLQTQMNSEVWASTFPVSRPPCFDSRVEDVLRSWPNQAELQCHRSQWPSNGRLNRKRGPPKPTGSMYCCPYSVVTKVFKLISKKSHRLQRTGQE